MVVVCLLADHDLKDFPPAVKNEGVLYAYVDKANNKGDRRFVAEESFVNAVVPT